MRNKDAQLFVFPYAGGSIAAMKRLTDLIDKRIDVITVEYPGRGTRAKEPFAASFPDLLEDAFAQSRNLRDESVPYAVFGYSMGSILAYEIVAKRAIPGDLKHLFIAAEVSPKARCLELRKIENPTDVRILDRARQLGGLDERLLANRRFADIYIKPMLSDYRLFFEYRFTDRSDRIKTDATFFYCERDTAYSDVCQWRELIEGNYSFHEMGVNHFFINQHYEEMARIINDTMTR